MPILLMLIAILFSSPAITAMAAEFHGGETWALAQGETVPEDLYTVGGSVGIGGKVKGDFVGAGGTVNVTGIIDQDATVAGGTVNIAGQVGDDVRAAGGSVTIGGKIAGDVIAAGRTVRLLPNSLVGGDVIASGGTVIIDGTIAGKIQANGRDVRIDGNAAGPTSVNATRLSLGKLAHLGAGLSYRSPRAASIAPGARISGTTEFTRAEREEAGAFGLWFFLRLAITLVSGIVAVWLFRNISRKLVRDSLEHPGNDLLRGFALLILVPITIVLLFITVVGLPIGFVAAFLYAASLIIANVYAGILVGSWLWKRVRKETEYNITIPAAITGIFVLWALGWIPVVGWLLQFALMLMVFGAIFHLLYNWARPARQLHATP